MGVAHRERISGDRGACAGPFLLNLVNVLAQIIRGPGDCINTPLLPSSISTLDTRLPGIVELNSVEVGRIIAEQRGLVFNLRASLKIALFIFWSALYGVLDVRNRSTAWASMSSLIRVGEWVPDGLVPFIVHVDRRACLE